MLDPIAKKTVLRQLTYGLYAVTAAHGDERGIFTANWLTQVSFDPPLIALSIERESATLPLIRARGEFAVSTFAPGQRELAGNLGRPRARAGDKFVAYELGTITSESGLPVLGSALGYVVARVTAEHLAGDSVLLVAEVVEARILNDGVPLTMRDAGFRHAG